MNPRVPRLQKTLLLRAVLAAFTAVSANSALAVSNDLLDEDVTKPASWSLDAISVEGAANIINRVGKWDTEDDNSLFLGSGLYIGYQNTRTGVFNIVIPSDSSGSFQLGGEDADRPELIPTIDPSLRVGDAGGNGTLSINFEEINPYEYLSYERFSSYGIGIGVGIGAGSTGLVHLLGGGKGQVTSYSPNHLLHDRVTQNSLIGQAGGQGELRVEGAGITFAIDAYADALNYFAVGQGGGSDGQVNILNNGKLAIGDSSSGTTDKTDQFPLSFIGQDGGTGTVTVAASNGAHQNQVKFGFGLAVGETGGTGTLDVLQGGKSLIAMGVTGNDSICNASDPEGYPLPPATLQISSDNASSGLVRSSGSTLTVAGHSTDDRSLDTTVLISEQAIGQIQIGTGGTLVAENGGSIQVGISRIGVEYTEDVGDLYKSISLGGLGPITVTGAGAVVYGSETPTATPAGEIQASLIDLQGTTAQLRFNHSGSLNFDRALAGNGTLVQQAGITTISGTLADSPELPVLQVGEDSITPFAFITSGPCRPAIADSYPSSQTGFTGGLDIQGGTMVLPVSAVLPNLSSTQISNNATLMMGSTDQNLAAVEFSGGLLRLTGGSAPSANNTATASTWSGGAGVVELDTDLGSDSSSDKLDIKGAITGTTVLKIANFSDAWAPTNEPGILVVQATQANPATSFVLAEPVIGGGLQYTLQQTGNNWYLVSSPYTAPPAQATPVPSLSWLGVFGMAALLAAASGRRLAQQQRRKSA